MYHGDVTSNSGPSNAALVTRNIRVDLCDYRWNLISRDSDASQEIEVRGLCKVSYVHDSCIVVKTCYML
jgi:hypothetical protein